MEKYLGDQSPERLLASAATGLGIAGGVFSNIESEFAPQLSGAPPEVDGVSVQVITDSYHHFFEASGKMGDVLVQRHGPSDDPPPKAVAAE